MKKYILLLMFIYFYNLYCFWRSCDDMCNKMIFWYLCNLYFYGNYDDNCCDEVLDF